MPKMHLRLALVLVDHLEKTKKKCKNLQKSGDSRYIYQNELDKACFWHDMAYGNFKTRRTASDKILCDKVSDISKNPRYDGYQRVLALMVYKSFDKKTSGSGIKNDNMLTSN